MKIELKKKQIPRDVLGDPAFKYLSTKALDPKLEGQGIFDVFTQEDVIYMINRYIYFVEAQQTAHAKRAKRQREALHLVRKKVRVMFGVSYDNATEEQKAKAIAALLVG